jgi:hypothetical protein
VANKEVRGKNSGTLRFALGKRAANKEVREGKIVVALALLWVMGRRWRGQRER